MSSTIKVIDIKSKKVLKEFKYFEAQQAIDFASQKEKEGIEIKIAIPKKLAESYEEDSDDSDDSCPADYTLN